MKRAQEDENRDFDQDARERVRDRQDDATAVERFENYPPGWLDGDEW